MNHEIPLERRTLHGHFSRELEPVVTIDAGDSVAFSTLDADWCVEDAPYDERRRFEPRDEELDAGHALIGPIEVRGARAGQTLAVGIDRLHVGTFGFTAAGGWPAWLNTRLGLDAGEARHLRWQLDAEAGTGIDQHGRTVDLRPFLGVMGMPPAEPGVHLTSPPRPCGGNLDCTELVEGTTLFLPIPVDGALFSAGDGHARQGDGEVCQIAIECPMERVELTLALRDDLPLTGPVARTRDAWITLGVDEDLDEAAALAVDSMLTLMERELSLDRRDAYALASVVVDLRVTQVVNGVKGVHAVLRDDAVR
ncbi:MAG TPA: acetamidase/formamidase family protein [Gaiellaceae bacterium]|nr:acetamidase/formamidase family protein [Gaiellaceae bacterium]